MLAALAGRAARPADKQRRITERGPGRSAHRGQHVETLAHLAVVGSAGVPAFRARGTDAEPGTLLATVHGRHGRRVVELEHGVALTEVLGEPDGDLQRPVLVGGYHGAWLDVRTARTATLSRSSLDAQGASPGAGVVVELPRGPAG